MAKISSALSQDKLKSAKEVSEFAESIIDTVREPLIALDTNLRVVKANQSFYDFFKVTSDNTIGTLIYNLGNNQWDIPKLRELLETILPEKTTFGNFEVEHVFPTIGKRIMLLNARKIKREVGKEHIILLAIENITERKHTEEAREHAQSEMNTLLQNLDDAIFSFDTVQNKMLVVSPAHEKIFGYPVSEFFKNAQLWYELVVPEDKPIVDAGYPVLYAGNSLQHEVRITHPEGQIRWIEVRMNPTLNVNGKLVRIDGIISDITERKRIKEEAYESEERFRIIFENLYDGISIYYEDPDRSKRKLFECNEQYAALAGRSRNELLQLGITHELQIVLENKGNDNRLEDPDRRTKYREGTFSWIRPDGKENVIEYRGMPITWRGKPYTIGLDRDITERKKTENELRKLSKVAEQSPVSIIITDTEGNIEYINPKLTELNGYQFAEVLGRNPRIFSSGEIPKSEYKVLWDTIISGKEWHGEIHNKKKNGDLYWELASISPIIDEKGKITHYLAVKEDITERKNAEEKLIESERKYKELTTLLPQSVFEVDLNGIITFANDFASETFGYSDKESLNILNYRMMVVPEERDKIVENAHRILNGDKQTGGEYTALRKDGTTFPVLVYSNLIMRNGKPIGIRGILVDISEIKEAEQELIKAKEKAESANKLKDSFIANISHEIRTPLNGVLGLTSLIKETYQSVIKKEDEELFEGVNISSNRIIRTIDMILNYSRLHVGEFNIKPKKINISNICTNLVKEFNTAANNKSLKLTFQNNCGDTEIVGDESSISMAISNLLDNAIKFTNKGFVKLTLYKGNNEDIILEIKDSGIGIHENFIESIFEPYGQEQMGYGRAYDGIGLGLAIVKKILDLNKDIINIESKKGEGTTFTINFGKGILSPGNKSEKEPAADIPRTPEQPQNKVVLIVEDDLMNQITIKKFIGNLYLTVTTDSLEGALEILNKNKVDIILMDISISGSKNGLELTKELKESKEFSHIPVTAHAFESDRQNALNAGCDDYLAKPFTKDSLLKIMASYIIK